MASFGPPIWKTPHTSLLGWAGSLHRFHCLLPVCLYLNCTRLSCVPYIYIYKCTCIQFIGGIYMGINLISTWINMNFITISVFLRKQGTVPLQHQGLLWSCFPISNRHRLESTSTSMIFRHTHVTRNRGYSPGIIGVCGDMKIIKHYPVLLLETLWNHQRTYMWFYNYNKYTPVCVHLRTHIVHT